MFELKTTIEFESLNFPTKRGTIIILKKLTVWSKSDISTQSSQFFKNKNNLDYLLQIESSLSLKPICGFL